MRLTDARVKSVAKAGRSRNNESPLLSAPAMMLKGVPDGDHGPGVPKAMLAGIFLPFQRVSEQSATDSQGSGLGLAIAERVARLHGGSIHALNANDGGLIVEFILPTMSEARP